MITCEKPNYIFKNHKYDKWKFLTHAKYIREGTSYPTVMEVPCGTCKSCLKNQSLKFKQRLMLQQEQSKTSYFITLTYSDNNLKDKSTHIIDLRKFLKKLKNYYLHNYGLKDIKFFGVSEYGDKTMRPHYHVIIFNIPIWEYDYSLLQIKKKPKRKQYIVNKWINENYFTNSKIKELWKKGNITITGLNEARINYIVSYLFKSMNGITKKERYEAKRNHMELPKRVQSQNLGLETILKNKIEFLTNDYTIINGEYIYANTYIDKKANIYTQERMEKRLYKRLDKIGTHKHATLNNSKGTL